MSGFLLLLVVGVVAGAQGGSWHKCEVPTSSNCALTAPSTARGSSRLGRRLLRLDALEGASLVENRPGDPRELVGERNRQHVVVQSVLGGFDPRFEAIALPTLYLYQHNPRGLHEQTAQIAIAAP